MISFADAEAKMRAKGVHPTIDFFPYIEGWQWVSFIESVRHSGVLNPITVTPNGVIIDGRMRYLAGLMTGRPAPEQVFEGDEDAIRRLIISANVLRTSFSDETQRVIAYKLCQEGSARWAAKHGGEPMPTLEELYSPSEPAAEAVCILPKRVDLRFDYSGMDQAVRDVAVAAVGAIRAHGKRAAESSVAIGTELAAVKEVLPHGAWLPWLTAEFGWSDQQARRFMQVAKLVRSNKLLNLEPIDTSALYLLAAPSTPEPVIEAAAATAACGERVTHGFVKEALARHKGGSRDRATEAARLRAEIERLRTRLAEIEAAASG